MKETVRAAKILAIFTLLLGLVYPLAITGAARVLFPKQAEGSLIRNADGKIMGSWLIGQPFTAPVYFWPRPSATSDFEYNPLASGGSNLGPTNKALLERVKSRVEFLRQSGIEGNIPLDLVTASASGLDPHISPEAAFAQAPRVAKARGLPEDAVRKLVRDNIEKRQFGLLGAERVNVLKLNLALDVGKI